MSYFLIDGWTTDDLQYLWKRKDPVQIVENLHLPRFTLEKYISDYCNIKTNTGKTYSIISAFNRQKINRCFSFYTNGNLINILLNSQPYRSFISKSG